MRGATSTSFRRRRQRLRDWWSRWWGGRERWRTGFPAAPTKEESGAQNRFIDRGGRRLHRARRVWRVEPVGERWVWLLPPGEPDPLAQLRHRAERDGDREPRQGVREPASERHQQDRQPAG